MVDLGTVPDLTNVYDAFKLIYWHSDNPYFSIIIDSYNKRVRVYRGIHITDFSVSFSFDYLAGNKYATPHAIAAEIVLGLPGVYFK